MKVLIADDSSTARKKLETRLTSWGYQPLIAANGREALEKLTKADPPRIAILDWLMPEMEGPTVCERLREDSPHYIYTIILTSKSKKRDLISALESGADEFITKPFDDDELQQRLRAARRILRLQEKLGRIRNNLEFEASHDPVTGVWNRRSILAVLDRELHRGKRSSSCTSVVLANLDGFTQLNDRYGSSAGDGALGQVAERIKRSLRSYDELGRFGGGEFLMVLPETDAQDAYMIAERIRCEISDQPLTPKNQTVRATVTLGVTTSISEIADGDTMISSARAALAEGQELGGNTVRVSKGDATLDLALKIIVVEEEFDSAVEIESVLKENGFANIQRVSSSGQVIETLLAGQPDALIVGAQSKSSDTLKMIETIRKEDVLKSTPLVLALDGENERLAAKLIHAGVTDFVSRSRVASDLILRLRNSIDAISFRRHADEYRSRLEQQVRSRTSELEASRRQVILCLARAAEYRDDDTGHHVIRVGRYAGIIARELGFSQAKVDLLEQAAQLHDVGKIGLPDDVLKKPGKLNVQEFEIIKNHCGFGKSIVDPVTEQGWSVIEQHTRFGASMLEVADTPILRLAAIISLTHHERFDGSGYPLGLAGDDIPIESRITAVADVYDALSTRRAYKPPYPREKCFSILQQGRGTQFDPEVLDAFFARADDIIRVQIDLADVQTDAGQASPESILDACLDLPQEFGAPAG